MRFSKFYIFYKKILYKKNKIKCDNIFLNKLNLVIDNYKRQPKEGQKNLKQEKKN